jgi:hypothetical protein
VRPPPQPPHGRDNPWPDPDGLWLPEDRCHDYYDFYYPLSEQYDIDPLTVPPAPPTDRSWADCLDRLLGLPVWAQRISGPTDFGLSKRELEHEIIRCTRRGWQRWELVRTFVDPARADRAGIAA